MPRRNRVPKTVKALVAEIADMPLSQDSVYLDKQPPDISTQEVEEVADAIDARGSHKVHVTGLFMSANATSLLGHRLVESKTVDYVHFASLWRLVNSNGQEAVMDLLGEGFRQRGDSIPELFEAYNALRDIDEAAFNEFTRLLQEPARAMASSSSSSSAAAAASAAASVEESTAEAKPSRKRKRDEPRKTTIRDLPVELLPDIKKAVVKPRKTLRMDS